MDDFLLMMGYRYYLIRNIIQSLKEYSYVNIDVIEEVCRNNGTKLSELTEEEKKQIFNSLQ